MNRARLKRLGGVDQHKLAIVLGLDLYLAFASDRDAVARVRLDAVHPNAAARHQIEMATGFGVAGAPHNGQNPC